MSIYLTNKYRITLSNDPLSHVLALFSHSYPSTKFDLQINYYWFNEPFAVSQVQSCLYLHVHGLIFETSIWLLAGSTRYLSLSNLILSFFPILSFNQEWDSKMIWFDLIWLIQLIDWWTTSTSFFLFLSLSLARLSEWVWDWFRLMYVSLLSYQ